MTHLLTRADYICVIIKPWMAEKMRTGVGSLAIIDNENGEFTITAALPMTQMFLAHEVLEDRQIQENLMSCEAF